MSWCSYEAVTFTEWCKKNRHGKVRWQLDRVVSKLRGHKNYFGVIGNSKMVGTFQYLALKIWRKWLSRRSNKGYVTLEKMSMIIKNHSYFKTQKALQIG